MPKFVVAVPQTRYYKVAAKTPGEALEKFGKMTRPRRSAKPTEFEDAEVLNTPEPQPVHREQTELPLEDEQLAGTDAQD